MDPIAEEAAFNQFVVARSSALMRTAYLLTQDHQLAEDLAAIGLALGAALAAMILRRKRQVR